MSATERIQLWDKFNGPVDQDIVKVQFFRKVRSANPPFRVKVKLAPRNRVSVPDMVRYHYKNPPELIPSLRDVLRLEYLESREDAVFVSDEETPQSPDLKALCQEVKIAVSAVESIKEEEERDEKEHISRTEARLNGVFELSCEGEQALDHVLHSPKEEVEPDDKGTIVKVDESAKKGKGKKRIKKGKVKEADNEVDSKDFKIICDRLEIEDDWHAVNGLVAKDVEKVCLHNGVHNSTTAKTEECAKTMPNNVSEDGE